MVVMVVVIVRKTRGIGNVCYNGGVDGDGKKRGGVNTMGIILRVMEMRIVVEGVVKTMGKRTV